MTGLTLEDLREAVRLLREWPRDDVRLYLLPSERFFYARYGWIEHLADGRTITTGRGPVSGGIEVLPINFIPQPRK